MKNNELKKNVKESLKELREKYMKELREKYIKERRGKDVEALQKAINKVDIIGEVITNCGNIFFTFVNVFLMVFLFAYLFQGSLVPYFLLKSFIVFISMCIILVIIKCSFKSILWRIKRRDK